MSQMVRAAALVAGMMVFGGIGYAQCKIAVIDMQEAVTGSNEGKEKAKSFDAKVADWQKKLDGIKNDIDTATKKLQAQQSLASAAVIADLNKQIKDKNTELTRTSEDAQKDVDDYRDSLLSPVMMSAEAIMQALAAEKGYSIVYDLSAPNSPIAYSSKECDITTEVKTRMNAKPGAAATTAAPPKGAAPAAATPAAPRGGAAAPAPARGGATTPATTPPASGAPRGAAPATTPATK